MTSVIYFNASFYNLQEDLGETDWNLVIMDTRKIIIESAFKLFESRSFSNITVNMILEQANCSRYSFYKYFRDKYELMYLYYSEFVTNLLEREYNGSNFEEIQAKIFQFIRNKRSFFVNVKDVTGPESFWEFLNRHTRIIFMSVRNVNERNETMTELEKMEMNYIVDGTVCVFRKYAENPLMNLSPYEISHLLCDKYPNNYYIILNNDIKAFRKAYQNQSKEIYNFIL